MKASKKEDGMPKTKLRAKRLPTFVPKDDEDNIESLNAGYEAKTAPYGYGERNEGKDDASKSLNAGYFDETAPYGHYRINKK